MMAPTLESVDMDTIEAHTMALFRARLGYAQKLREQNDSQRAEMMEAFAYELLEHL